MSDMRMQGVAGARLARAHVYMASGLLQYPQERAAAFPAADMRNWWER